MEINQLGNWEIAEKYYGLEAIGEKYPEYAEMNGHVDIVRKWNSLFQK